MVEKHRKGKKEEVEMMNALPGGEEKSEENATKKHQSGGELLICGWEERIAALEGIIHRQDEELRRVETSTGAFVQIRRDAENRDPPAAVVYPATEARHELLAERFRKQHPPEFEGGIDPVVAEEWISRIESILQMLRVDGNDRVKCASYMLRKDARIWWEVVEQTKDVDTMNWDDFKRVFNEKYYNSAVLAAKVDEFTGLVQGSLTVTEYAQKFDRLIKFAPDLVPTDRVRAHRFVEGLKPMVARDVEIVSRGQFSFAQVVEMALTAERSENKIWKENAARRESKKGGANSNDHKKRGRDRSGRPSQDKRYKSDNDQRFNGGGGRNIPNALNVPNVISASVAQKHATNVEKKDTSNAIAHCGDGRERARTQER
ncbi:uncharacterized protein LOC133030550 [Cannabis sativa]|uniref:uncharacterized protein LOC133030550 n=1 Tax=Cannabis sativa TaxID=3483 RepID=UPI0029C9CCF1|nr:uncharacterized protein LOC133030550 [Cannabis sativa]